MSKPNMLETALLSQWGRCLDEAEVIYDRKTAEVFEAAKRGLLKRFLDEAGAAADIGGCDERLYACCGRVTDCCRRAVAIYEANKSWLVSDGIGAVLAEAASALASRIRLFDESRDRESNYENPVVSEKKSILGTGAAYFVHEAQSAEERFKEQTKAERAKAGRPAARRPDGERSNAAWQNEERSNAAWQNEERSRPFPTSALGLPSGGNVDDFILQGAAESLREAYDKSLAITAGRLADLSAHGKTAFYMDLLESERDALVAVVNAQVPAMLGELEGDAATSHEKTIILGVLSVIREAYRYLAGEAA
ncbi:MAG: hypothetical protein FWC55_05695, partial [Firmicutes bacterium]|nr:hypothetical protein [Bacillota bacterium]